MTKTLIFITVFLCLLSPSLGNAASLSDYLDEMDNNPQSFRFPEPVELVVAVEEWIPHIGVSRNSSTGLPTISGPMAHLLDALATTLNFKYRLVQPPDAAWGIPLADGSGDWNGMIGMVKRNEADIALGPFGVTASRSKVVSFSSPILIDYYRILVQRQTPQPDPWGWRSPYTLTVWGCFGGCLVLCAVLLWATTFHFGMGSTKGAQGTVYPGFWGHVWHVYGLSISQSLDWLPTSWSGKTLASVWLIIVVIATKSYNSSLTSLLAVRTVSTPYNYLMDLVNDEEVSLVFEAATALVEHLSTVENGIYAMLAAENDRSKFLTSSGLFVAAYGEVRSTKAALLVEDTTCRKVMSDDFTKYGRCDFYIGKERYWPLIFALIGKKNHPVLKTISARIDRIVSHDLYFSWLNRELPNATACLNAPSKVIVREPYSISGLWGLFVVMAMGALGSTLCLTFEMIYFNIKK